MKKVNFIIVIVLILIDRIIKEAVLFENIELIPDILTIKYVENSGIAFGIMNRYNSIIILVNIVLIVFLFVYVLGINIKTGKIYGCLTFILAGSIGNLIDRIFYGYVIDYISILDFPIFNLADMLIVIGMILFVVEINRVGVYGKI